MKQERLDLFETIAKREGQLQGALALELVEHVRELEERLDRVRELVRVMEQHGILDLTTLTQLRIALDGELKGEEA